jgi:hypothetical protein
MNYQQLIEAFKQFAADHKQIKTFGYGTISDIEVPVDPSSGEPADRDYPYLFINPTSHNLTTNTVTYGFNVIAMTMTSDLQSNFEFSGLDSVIKSQSDMLLIINDFLGWLEYTNDIESMLVQTTAVTPFKERFNDTVAGMTAAIQVQFRNTLDLCDAPITE